MFCDLQPGILKTACHAAQEHFKDSFNLDNLTDLDDEYTPDEYCLVRGFCTSDHQPTCYLFPEPEESWKALRLASLQEKIGNPERQSSLYAAFCDFTDQTRQFCNVYIKAFAGLFGDAGREISDATTVDWESLEASASVDADPAVVHHWPQFDRDNDRFGPRPGLRGYHWRGFDCDDSARSGKNVYPGRSAQHNDWDGKSDSNCNGISGKDENGVAYEEKFCSEYPGKGVIALGDSATAHFHLPQHIFMGGEWDENTFADLLTLVKNEADWPMLSWGTGYDNVSPKWSRDFTNLPTWPDTNSLYQRLREHNRCVHNDFQNIGLNGARSGSMQSSNNGIMYAT